MFWRLGENEVLLVRTGNFKNRTINFKGVIRNFKGEKLFCRQDEENFGKGGSNVFNFHEHVGPQQLRPRSTYSIQRAGFAITKNN